MEYTQLTPAPGQGECRDLFLPGLLLRNCSFEATLSISGCGERERHIFVFLSNMQGEARMNGRPLHEGLAVVCGAHPFEAVLPPMDMLGLTITRELVDEYLENVEGLVAPDWMDNGIHMVGDLETTAKAAGKIKALIANHHDDPGVHDDEGREAVIASVLDILVPVIIVAEAATDYGRCNRYEMVRRTREYILDRIDERLQISDICRDVGVSRRALQYSFQDVLGINPVAFVRVVRLNSPLTKSGSSDSERPSNDEVACTDGDEAGWRGSAGLDRVLVGCSAVSGARLLRQASAAAGRRRL